MILLLILSIFTLPWENVNKNSIKMERQDSRVMETVNHFILETYSHLLQYSNDTTNKLKEMFF